MIKNIILIIVIFNTICLGEYSYDDLNPGGKVLYVPYGDFNTDLIVNLEDFNLFKNEWLTTTDPNFIDEEYIEIGNPLYDLNRDSFINLEDLLILSSNWLNEGYWDFPPIPLYFDGQNIDNLQGEVWLQANFYGYTLQSACVFVNGIYHSSFTNSYGIILASLETNKLDNGINKIQIAGLTPWGNVQGFKEVNIIVNNYVSSVQCEDYFLTGQDHPVSFNCEGEGTIRVGDWSMNFYGNTNLVIPNYALDPLSEIVVEEFISSFDEAVFAFSGEQGDDIPDTYKKWRKKCYQKFDPNNLGHDPNSIRKIYILPFEDVTDRGWDAIRRQMEADQNHNMRFVVLNCHDANWENVSWALTEISFEELYYEGHGNSEIDLPNDELAPVYRTSIMMWQETNNSWPDKWQYLYVVSYKKSDFAWAPQLPGNLENTTKSMWSLKIHSKPRSKLPKWVCIKACMSAKYLDMAKAFSFLWDDDRNAWGAYMGWSGEVASPGSGFHNMINLTNKFLVSVFKWSDFGNSLSESVRLAEAETGNGVVELLWGEDREQGTGDDNLIFLHRPGPIPENLYLHI
jgi:hypothetical protein